MSCRWITLQALLLWGIVAVPAAGPSWARGDSAPTTQPQAPAVLARSVPPDARLFLELVDVRSFLQTRAGQEFTELLAGLMPSPMTRPATQPAPSWQQALGEKLGLRGPRAAQLLFTGRLALAADGWNEIDDAVLLVEPLDPAALEAELQGLRIQDPSQAKVRRYRLEADHELACDGRTVVAGLSRNPADLYQRTLTLWVRDRLVTLANVVEFRERITALPGESHIVFYSGQGVSPAATRPGGESSILWPRFTSAAVGVVMNGRAVTVEASARLTSASPPKDADPPIDSLVKVPASTLVAWTRPIRYAEEFRRLEATYPEGAVRFYLEMLQRGLPAGALESRLLRHLVGESIIMIGQQPMAGTETGRGVPLLLPALALAVETDDPDAVSAMLLPMAANLLELLNLQPPTDGPLRVQETQPAAGGPVIRSLPLGRFFASYTTCEFLRAIEISWTVADRWLVVATHPGMVRQIVEVRRGAGQPVAVGVFQQALARVKAHRGVPQMALIARPGAAAAMIDSWKAYVQLHHPEMLQRDWWDRLRRRQLANSVQLGMVPGPAATQPGVVVDRTLPGWPAHSRLLPGDRIMAVDEKAIDASKPLASLRERLANRPRPERVTLRINRGGKDLTVEIAMLSGPLDAQPIQPFDLLENLADLLRVFSSASFITWQPSQDLVNARLELELAPPAPTITIIGPSSLPAALPSPGTRPAPSTVVSPATLPARPITLPAAPVPPTCPAPVVTPPEPPATAPATAPVPSSRPVSRPSQVGQL